MAVLKLHKTVGVRVGPVQVGGGAPVVVQSMTMTDTADARRPRGSASSWREAGSDMVRVTVNVPEAAAAVPEIKRRMLDAGVTAPLIGDFHYNGHLLLTRYPGLRGRARQVPDQSRQRRHRRAARRAVRDHLRRRARPEQAGAHRRQRRLAQPGARRSRRCRRTPIATSGLTSEEIINECMVLSALQSTELALESGLRKDQIIISCKTSRPRDLIAVYRELARRTDQPLHLGLTEAGMGTKGPRVVGLGDGRAAERGDRRHDPRLADAASGRRSARRGLCRVRAAAGARHPLVLAERDRVPRLRAHDEQHVPGARRADAGLHPRAHARMEDPCTKGSKR